MINFIDLVALTGAKYAILLIYFAKFSGNLYSKIVYWSRNRYNIYIINLLCWDIHLITIALQYLASDWSIRAVMVVA